MHLIIRLLINALALLAISYMHAFGIHVDGIWSAVLVALVLGLANAIVRPILILISCPLVILSLGLFTLVINAVIFLFVDKIVPGFHVPGFWAAFWGAILMSVISWAISLVIREPESERRSNR
jgi:putative membrane protein